MVKSSMSQENVELVRSICAPWEHGDFSSVEWAHPEIELVIKDGPMPGRWTGMAGMAEGWRNCLTAIEDLRAKPEAYLEMDEGRVLVPLHNTGRGRASGLELGQVQSKGANLFHVRGGKVIKLVIYFNRENVTATD